MMTLKKLFKMKLTTHKNKFFLATLLVLFPAVVFAQTNPPVQLEIGIGSKIIATNLADYMGALYQFAVGAVAILATVMIMYNGLRWAAAAGNSGTITKAKDGITSALAGLVLALSSYLILHTLNPKLTDLSSIVVPKPNTPPVEDFEASEAPPLPTDTKGVCPNTVDDATCTGLVTVDSRYTQKMLTKAVHKLAPNAAGSWNLMAATFYAKFNKKIPANHMFRSFSYQQCLHDNSIGDHPSDPDCSDQGHISGGAVDLNISSLSIAQYNWLACGNEGGCVVTNKSTSGYNVIGANSYGWKVLNYNPDFNPSTSKHNHITEDHHFGYTGSTSVCGVCPGLDVSGCSCGGSVVDTTY
ncbi:MAG: hypothetical protein HYV32_03225 [Candidatus Kerfeldbacteria bacterium]|nr:hypothetical protein [Candidatus Kerfeldbacteria bacterium]